MRTSGAEWVESWSQGRDADRQASELLAESSEMIPIVPQAWDRLDLYPFG
jgi:hypothetical protein